MLAEFAIEDIMLSMDMQCIEHPDNNRNVPELICDVGPCPVTVIKCQYMLNVAAHHMSFIVVVPSRLLTRHLANIDD